MIQAISRYEDLCAIREEWGLLWDRAAGATVFQSSEWLLPWWTHLFQGGEMWTIAVWRESRLVGLAPMFVYGDRRVALAGAGVSDYSGFLAEDLEAARDIWSAIAESDHWDRCEFQDVWFQNPLITAVCGKIDDSPRPDGHGLRALQTLPVRAGWKVEVCEETPCPVIALASDFAAGFSAKFRHNLQNARNRLAKLGATFETAQAGQDLEFLDALFRLHTARWEATGQKGVLGMEMQQFLCDSCRGFRNRGWLRLHGLRLEGRLRAVVCIFCALGRSLHYIGGFDPELSRYSPGSAVIRFAIESAIADGSWEFDFLRQGESYKYKWGVRDRVNLRVTVRHSATSAEDR